MLDPSASAEAARLSVSCGAAAPYRDHLHAINHRMGHIEEISNWLCVFPILVVF